jgi:predicted small metal-binding protein
MTKIINCDCGRVLRGDTDDELVAAAQKHAREAHGMELTREQVLALAVPA